MTDEVVARHLIISGRVQGVWYRAWTMETASGIGLKGWVRNRVDGSVEAVLQGTKAQVDEMINLCYDGPPQAVVDRISITEIDTDNLMGFEKRVTD